MKAYWWVSVGGAPCEPAVLSDEGVFTLGCPDPHPRDSIDLVQPMNEAPPTPAEAAIAQAEWEKRRALELAKGVRHGYRRFV